MWPTPVGGSTFSDPEAEPDGIDFEGLNAIVLFRQPQIRWSVRLSDRWRLALALEDPRPDLTGATGVNQVPDFVGRALARSGYAPFGDVSRHVVTGLTTCGEPAPEPTGQHAPLLRRSRIGPRPAAGVRAPACGAISPRVTAMRPILESFNRSSQLIPAPAQSACSVLPT